MYLRISAKAQIAGFTRIRENKCFAGFKKSRLRQSL